MALAAVATLAVSAVAAPAPAHAQRDLGAAVAGGLIGGAIVGGAIAAGPGYYGWVRSRLLWTWLRLLRRPGLCRGTGTRWTGCYWQRQRFWDGYGWRIRRVRVCG